MNVYGIFVNECRIPLTVIADSYEAAEQLYLAWREAQGLGLPCKWKQVALRDSAWLADHPQLAGLAGNGTAGIAYWLSHREGWTLASPEDEPVGQLQPPKAPVRCFWIELDGGFSSIISATSQEHAVTMFLAWQQGIRGRRPRRFTVREKSRWLLTGDKYVLREEMDAGMMGIAARAEPGGWHIFPPDDVRVIP